jgi:hypothetical protein
MGELELTPRPTSPRTQCPLRITYAECLGRERGWWGFHERMNMISIDIFPHFQEVLVIFGLLVVSMFVAAVAAMFPKEKK